MSRSNGDPATKHDILADRDGTTAGEPGPPLGDVATYGAVRQVLRTAAAVGYVPIAVTEQLFSHSQPALYYTGVAALAVVGAIDWPVAGVVAAGVWVARRPTAV